jgi:DNA polymerase
MTEDFKGISKAGLLNKVKSVLQFHQSLGIDTLPKNTAVDTFLRIEAGQVSPPGMAETGTFSGSPQESGDVSDEKVPEILLSLMDISAEVVSCSACELHKQRLYPVAGRGEKNVRLMVIGDWLSPESDESLPPGQIFGVQQDMMLGKMLAAINLLSTDVYITNVIKCAIPSRIQPQACHVQSCLSFLRRQIVLLDPEIICTMGMIAARAVLNQSQSLSQSRGRFHEYDIGNGRHIPVLTTYHPTYLLRNPEMKTATWSDLQFLARKMGLQTVA